MGANSGWNFKKTWGHYLGSSPYGDDPADQAWILKGINYYENVYSKLTPAQRKLKSDACNITNSNNIPFSGIDGGASNGGGTNPAPTTPPVILPSLPPISSGWHAGGGPNCGDCHKGTIVSIRARKTR